MNNAFSEPQNILESYHTFSGTRHRSTCEGEILEDRDLWRHK